MNNKHKSSNIFLQRQYLFLLFQTKRYSFFPEKFVQKRDGDQCANPSHSEEQWEQRPGSETGDGLHAGVQDQGGGGW